MERKKTIGELIEKEVRKQGISITAFADSIFCQRNNVYDIFKRSKMDVVQLGIISRVLKHNFFKDLAEDITLSDMDNPEMEKDLYNRKAVSQFIEVVPKILTKMGKEPIISFGRPLSVDETVVLPDFMLTDYLITFSIGESLKEKANGCFGNLMIIETYTSEKGIAVDLWINRLNGSRSLNIKLDYKSESEWDDTLRYVFDNFYHKQHEYGNR
ncbi:hypothetical protein [Bacteroides sp. UBA939]|uniref:hypothetical protein n=1 Tax=Bacteroides sp. UBA939 TaxID=1946092 RepID=UPI0025C1FE31|nr:hypothetical protein [Bacteroides sp. UBA939]